MNFSRSRLVAVAALAVGVVPALAGCGTATAEADASPTGTERPVVRAAQPPGDVVVLDATDPAELALTASETFFAAAPVVVLVAADDAAAQATASAAAVELAAPVLLIGGAVGDDAVRAELERLGAATVVEVREEAVPGQSEGVGDTGPLLPGGGPERVRLDTDAMLEATGELDPRDLDEVREALPERGEPDVLREVLVLTEGRPEQSTAIATARAAGAWPLQVPGGDPRAGAETVEAIRKARALAVVGIGTSFGSTEDLAWRVRAAENGHLLPGGSQLLFAGQVYVSVPADAVTRDGVAVGAGAADDAVARARQAAAAFAERREDVGVVPVLEIPLTLTSSRPGADGDYSTELPAEEVRPLVEEAAGAGVQVVLRLEPGRATFDEQVVEYAELVALPGVGLALDVEARRVDGGVVDAAEVAAVVERLAALVRDEGLPQKLLVVQQDGPGSVAGLDELPTGDGELAVLLQPTADGGYASRMSAWRSLAEHAPAGARVAWTTASADPALDADGVLAVEPVPEYVAGR